MRHVITGGSGFLGNLLARRLRATGQEVVLIDVWEDQTRPKDIKFVNCDILNRDLVRATLSGADIVHHTAALVPLTKSREKFHQVNVIGSQIVAEEAAAAGVKCFIHASSSAIFGAPKCPAGNNSPLVPLEIYGKSKLEGELAVREVAEKTGMKLVAVRPRTILGEERLGIFQILFDWIKDGSNIFVLGDGSNKIQFLHADDLIDAYMLVYEVGKPGLYNVGSDSFGTLRNDLETLIRHANSQTRVIGLPEQAAITTLQCLDKLGLSPLAPWHYLTYGKDFYFDLKPLLDLGWKPKYSNERMLRESYDSFLANHAQLSKVTTGSAHRKPVKERALRVLKVLSKIV
jgi:nucleoside-diphosphate-sugar epimerase